MVEDTAPTATQHAQAVAEAFLAALAGRGDLATYLAADVTFTATETGEVTSGCQAVIAVLDYLHRRAFDAAPVVRSLVAAPGQVLIEADFVGTHVGELAGVAPTGRVARVPYAIACDVAEGTITAIRAYLSLDTLLRQIR